MSLSNMQLKEVLKGKKAGKIQKVGIMQVIPLFHQSSDLADHGIATPKQALKTSTTNYGSFAFKSTDPEKVAIIPSHYGVMTKHASQDHAMSRAGLLGPKSQKTFNDAFCIESSQGGMMPAEAHSYVILPYTLRNKVNKMGRGQGYNRLWNDIEKFNSEMGAGRRGHLSDFFKKHNDKLGEFVAQFECLPKQIGAIILIDNEVVGLEVAPNADYWLEVWEPLIRACYGSETVRRLLLKKASEKDHVLTDSKITQATSLTELEDAVYRFEENERSKSEAIVNSVMNQKLKFTPYGDNVIPGKYVCADATNSTYAGQVVMDDGYVIYASLVANATRALKKTDFAF